MQQVRCPWPVKIIAGLLIIRVIGAAYFVSLFMREPETSYLMSIAIRSGIVPIMIMVGVMTLVSAIFMLKGANWARWMYLGICIFNLFYSLVILKVGVTIIPELLISAVALFFLFRTPANEYFAAMSAHANARGS